MNKLSCGQLFSFLLKLFQLLDLSVPMVTARKRKGKVTNNDTEKEQEEMAKMAEEMAEEMVFNKWEESIDTMNLLHTQSTEVEFDENVINSVHQCLLLVKQYGIYQVSDLYTISDSIFNHRLLKMFLMEVYSYISYNILLH